jgi:hypothetical protein
LQQEAMVLAARISVFPRDVVQEEIAGSIANALRLRLGAGPRYYTDNLEAYQLYLRGRYTMERFQGPHNALPYFEQAIAKDANYALAYAGAADAFVAMDDNFLLPQPSFFNQRATALNRIESFYCRSSMP